MSRSFAGWDELTLGRAADLVTGALSLEDELDLRSSVDPRDLEEFELAAGELALLLRPEPIPADSAQRIESAVRLELQRSRKPQGHHAAGRRSSAGRGPTGSPAPRTAPTPSPAPAARLGWVVALVLLGWIVLEPTLRSPRSVDEVLASAADAVRAAWSRTDDPLAGEATGEVRWSDRAGVGTMRFEGLPVNDPGEFQYQLWIFDASRADGADRPVDGGVFDITGPIVEVPIDARLPVGEATMFAITRERPGGVVVSEREHLLLTAAVPES